MKRIQLFWLLMVGAAQFTQAQVLQLWQCKERGDEIKNIVGPYECHFSFSYDGHSFTPIGRSFKTREGKWIGAKPGFPPSIETG